MECVVNEQSWRLWPQLVDTPGGEGISSAYLEATSPRNAALYKCHGFVRIGEIPIQGSCADPARFRSRPVAPNLLTFRMS
jgi:hypothetical protein